MIWRVYIVGLLVTPQIVFGAVVISEIAWMGDSESANNEWIELYNDSATAVDVTGWQLVSDTGLAVDLVGTVGAGAYAVLERTDEGSAPGTAFVVYAGALANTGNTLQLYDASDNLVDQVAGGVDWKNIGGDNTTKETAQLAVNGWQTGAPTPGAVNEVSDIGSISEEVAQNVDETAVSNTDSRGSGQSVVLVNDGVLAVSITGPQTVQRYQPVTYTVTPSGLGEAAMRSLTYDWHMGDMTMKQGHEVTHQFAHPGTYVLSVTGEFADFAGSGRKTVTVLPVKVSLSYASNGDVLIHNNVPYEQDVSGYRVFGTQTASLPVHTYLVPNGTIRIPRHMVRPQRGLPVVLYTPDNHEIATTKTQVETAYIPPAPVLAGVPAPYTPSPIITEPVSKILGESSSTVATTAPQILHTKQPIPIEARNDRSLYALWFIFVMAVLLILFRNRF